MSEFKRNNPLELSVGDVHLLLSGCYDAGEKPSIIRKLTFMSGEIPVQVEVGGHFHGYKVVRIVESQTDFIVCVEDERTQGTVLSSSRILRHHAIDIAYDL